MPLLLEVLTVPLLAYGGVIGAMALFQRRLLFRPQPDAASPEAAGAPWMQAVRQGGRLLGWYAPPPEAAGPVLVFFHGNGGTLARVAGKTAPWRDLGLGLFAATYRGYAGNAGRPDEAGLYADARAVLDWLAGRGIAAERLILYGESLGSGVAAQLAVERRTAATVLEAPYVSMSEVAAWHYPWAPARWVVRDRFDTLSKIGRLQSPLLILHGTADRTIPVGHARRLAAAAPGRTELAVLAEAGHTDLFERGAFQVLQDFLSRLGLIRLRNSPSCLAREAD